MYANLCMYQILIIHTLFSHPKMTSNSGLHTRNVDDGNSLNHTCSLLIKKILSLCLHFQELSCQKKKKKIMSKHTMCPISADTAATDLLFIYLFFSQRKMVTRISSICLNLSLLGLMLF